MTIEKGEQLGFSFNPKKGPPPFPEDMVDFYVAYIPEVCKTKSMRHACEEALKERDILKLNKLLAEAIDDEKEPPTKVLTEEEETEMLRGLGYDI